MLQPIVDGAAHRPDVAPDDALHAPPRRPARPARCSSHSPSPSPPAGPKGLRLAALYGHELGHRRSHRARARHARGCLRRDHAPAPPPRRGLPRRRPGPVEHRQDPPVDADRAGHHLARPVRRARRAPAPSSASTSSSSTTPPRRGPTRATSRRSRRSPSAPPAEPPPPGGLTRRTQPPPRPAPPPGPTPAPPAPPRTSVHPTHEAASAIARPTGAAAVGTQQRHLLGHQHLAPPARVDQAHDAGPVEHRHGEVAVDALLLRRVRLEPVPHVEETLEAFPVPDERVERGQQHGAAPHPGAHRAERAGIGIGGLRPPCHRHLRQPGRVQHPAHERLRTGRGTWPGRPAAPRRAHGPPLPPAARRTPRRSSPAPAAQPGWRARPGRRRGRSRAARGRPVRRCRAATRRRSWSPTSPTTGRPSWPHRVGWRSTDLRRAGGPAPRRTTCPSPPAGASAGPWPANCRRLNA